MKKIVLSGLIILAMTVFTVNHANAEQKIATVDIQKIIENSTQVKTINKEQETKIQELEKWVETVKADIEKQKTQEGKEKLFVKYRDSYISKKNDIIKQGQTKMQAFMDKVSDTIDAEAKAKGYDMIITKGVVVYGGEDITQDVQNALNNKTVVKAAPVKKETKKK